MDFRTFARDRIMIMSAPNGARRTHADHPALPISPAELADCAERILEAGVSVLHLHVRDDQGRHSLDVDRYRSAMAAIRDRVGDRLVLQATTEAVGIYSAEQQMAMVRELRPEAVSLALRELCPSEQVIPQAGAFFSWCLSEGIWPQYILYSPEEVARFEGLRRLGVFGEDHPSALFVLGRYASDLTGNPDDLELFLEAAGTVDFPWACCCFGRTELDAMKASAQLGGHVRIGFENNLHMENGKMAADNAALIAGFVNILPPSGRRPATAQEVRETFHSSK